MDKVFASPDQQLKILRRRGLTISNASRAKKIIEMENYYNLINGYKELFLDRTASKEQEDVFLTDARFEEIYSLYLFDRELRNLYIRYILEIENNIKSVLANVFSKKYGHDNYLKVSNFDTSVKKWEKKTSAQKIGEVSDLISKLQHEIARQLSKNNPMISHYMLVYGYVPLWVLVNTLTLGTISTFYSYLSQKDQNDIGRFFSLKPAEMNSFLQLLTIFRNACAHDERLYNLRALRKNMKPNYIKTLPIHHEMKIPLDESNNPVWGKNDLFAVVIIFKTMLPRSTFNKFYYAQKRLLADLEKSLYVIDIRRIEESMGFPLNWQEIRGI